MRNRKRQASSLPKTAREETGGEPRTRAGRDEDRPSDETPQEAAPTSFEPEDDAAGGATRADDSQTVDGEPQATRSECRVARVSFSMPDEYTDLVDVLRDRLAHLGVERNVTEIVHAGLKVLTGLCDDDLRAVLEKVTRAEKGRYCLVRWSENGLTMNLSAILMSSGEYHVLIPRKE